MNIELLELLERFERVYQDEFDEEESREGEEEETNGNSCVIVLCILPSREEHLIEWYTSGFE